MNRRSWSQRIFPEDNKSLRSWTFEVSSEARSLVVRFGYAPVFSNDPTVNAPLVKRALDDYLEPDVGPKPTAAEIQRTLKRKDIRRSRSTLRNLINWNLYDPAGRFRGRWDWSQEGKTDQIAIGTIRSSRGFLDGPIAPGRWRVVLEVHLICTDDCRFEFEVTPEPGVGHCHASSPGIERLQRCTPTALPTVRPREGWLRGEMHSHSTHSDGHYSVEELARRAHAAGLDFLALTDHNTTSGHSEALARTDVVFLPGEELTTFSGHFGLYGLDHTVEWHRDGRVTDISRLFETLRAEGVYLSLAHPYQIGDPVCVGCRWNGQAPPLCSFDFLEVWVGCWQERSVEIVRALALWDRILDQGHEIVAVAARDWHGAEQEDGDGRRFARNMVATDRRDPAAVLERLSGGASYLTVGPHIDLRLTTNGRDHGLGDSPRLRAGEEARLTVQVQDPWPTGTRLRLRSQDGTLAETATDALEINAPEPGRYRAELWTADGDELLLVTNHLYLTLEDGGTS